MSICWRSAERSGAVFAAPAFGTGASTCGGGAVGELVAGEGFEVAVEAGWAVFGPVVVEREGIWE